MQYLPSNTNARGLAGAAMAISVLTLGLTGCETTSIPEPKYPIYMQNRPPAPAPAPVEAPVAQPTYLTPVPPVGSVSSSDLPPPPPPPSSIIRPSVPATAVPARPAPLPVSAPTGPISYSFAYTMQPHDTLFGVSRRFGVPIQTILAGNNLTISSPVSIGQKILLPSTARDNGAEERASGPGLIAVRAAPAPQPVPAPPVVQPAPQPVPQPKPQPVPAPVPPASSQSVAALGKGKFIWPVRGNTLVKYGQLGPNVRNDGINIGASKGTPVVAAADGYVLIVLTNSNQTAKDLGNTVYIQNGNGWYTGYSHLDSISVKQNQQVKQGQVIGTVGATGAVDVPQLHFEIRYTPSKEIARPIDPTLVLPTGR